MAILIDTNVLLRAVQPSYPMHSIGLGAVEKLLAGNEPLYIAIQNVSSFIRYRSSEKLLSLTPPPIPALIAVIAEGQKVICLLMPPDLSPSR
jgi:hypothetical protein